MSEKSTIWFYAASLSVAILALGVTGWSGAKGAVLPDNPASREDILSEVQAMYGLTEAQAIERLVRETEAAELDRLIRNLEIKSYAGSWFDSETWTLHVALSNPDDVPFIESLGGTPVLVERSLVELKSIRNRAEARLGESLVTRNAIRETYIDYRTNQVVIGMTPASMADAESVLAAHGLNSSSVKVVAAQKIWFSAAVRGANSMCNATLDTPPPDPTQCHAHPCSVGVSVVGGYVTAGHCGEDGDTIRTDPPDTSQLLGQMINSTMTIYDLPFPDPWTYSFAHNEDGAWVNTSSGWTPKPQVNGYLDGIFSISSKWSGVLEAPVGATVFRYGQTSGPSMGGDMGEIEAKNVTINKTFVSRLDGMTKASGICSDDGDSGGPYVTPAAQIQGTNSATTTGNTCPDPATAVYFQPIQTTLDRFDKTMLTPHGSVKPTINGFDCPFFANFGNYTCRISSYDSQGNTNMSWTSNTGASSDTRMLQGTCFEGQTVNVNLAVSNPYGTRNQSASFACVTGPPE